MMGGQERKGVGDGEGNRKGWDREKKGGEEMKGGK